MKIKLLIIGICISLFATAQSTISTTDMPFVNDTIRISTSGMTIPILAIDSVKGSNKIWDLSLLLVPGFQDIATFKPVAAINTNYNGSFGGNSSYGIQDANISLGAYGTATNVFNFFKNSTTGFVGTGRGFTFNNTQVPIVYSGAGDVIYSFGTGGTSLTYPYSYSSVIAGSGSITVPVIGSVPIIVSGKRIDTVDGWGKLVTPMGTFTSCLRVKSIYVDTVKVLTSNSIRNYTEYTWLATVKKIPLLSIRIDNVTGATSIYYQDINRPSVFANFAGFRFNKQSALANGMDSITLTDTSLHSPNSVMWSVTPAASSTLSSSTSSVTNVKFTIGGLYTVTLTSFYNAGSSTVIRTGLLSANVKPVANFYSSTIAHTGDTIILHDTSTGIPAVNIWRWTITPTTYHYVNGATYFSKNPAVVFDSSGAYTIKLAVTNAVGADSITRTNYMTINHTGINNLTIDNSSVSLFPNPAKDHFTVNTSNQNISLSKIEVFDITGKNYMINYSEQNNSLTADCSGLSKGMYFVKIYTNDNQFIVRKITMW